ncbi:MAG: hypothetical protein ACP5HQ_09120 [Thermoprotei archaeon]
MTSRADVGYAQKGGGEEAGDVSPVPLGSKESHDPPAAGPGGRPRAKSLRSIMSEYKVSEMKAQGQTA